MSTILLWQLHMQCEKGTNFYRITIQYGTDAYLIFLAMHSRKVDTCIGLANTEDRRTTLQHETRYVQNHAQQLILHAAGKELINQSVEYSSTQVWSVFDLGQPITQVVRLVLFASSRHSLSVLPAPLHDQLPCFTCSFTYFHNMYCSIFRPEQ